MSRAQFSAPVPPETDYCFVDNAYLRRQFADTMTAIYGSYELGARALPYRAKRTFIYDCADVKRADESQAEYEVRMTVQESFLDGLKSIPGYHVRLGTLTKGRRPAQKKVDVQLAVDMLMHAHNRNMDRAILVTGDLDFKPVVDALVLMGTYVIVAAKPTTISRELKQAADAFWSLEPALLYDLSSDAFKAKFPKPAMTYYSPDQIRFSRVDSQSHVGEHVVTMGIAADSTDHQIAIANHGPNPGLVLRVQANNLEVAKRWVSIQFGVNL